MKDNRDGAVIYSSAFDENAGRRERIELMIVELKGGLGVTYSGNGQNNNRLAEKLRGEYRNRGASLQGVQATSTSELMARAQMGRDPKVNVSAQAFEDRLYGREFGYRYGEQKQYAAGSGRNSGTGRNPGAGKSSGTGPYSRQQQSAGTKKASSGGYASRCEPFRMSAQDQAWTGANPNTGPRQQKNFREEELHRVKFAESSFAEADEEEDVFEEIKVDRKKMPKTFLVVLALSTIMIMLIIMSVAQIYQTTQEVSTLEDTIEKLKETIDDLELKLDEKNDIRLIEQMATTEMGMVKEDSLQRKYISLSNGERVDLIENPNAVEEGGTGTMLSSIFSVFSDFFEYFK